MILPDATRNPEYSVANLVSSASQDLFALEDREHLSSRIG